MMEKSLQVFRYEEQAVRTVEVNGEAWLVAKDVCDILGIVNARDAVSELDDDEKNTVAITDGNRGNPNTNVINEAGLYKLTFKSRKPAAKEFTRWVTHEVLPTLRKTGSYSTKHSQPELPSGVIEGARIIFESAGITGNQAALALDNIYQSYTGHSALKTGRIELEAESKRQLLTPTEIGKRFGLKPHRVNEILAGAGYQHKIAEKWEPLGRGEKYAVMLDTGKRQKGTPIRQLKWDSRIIGEFMNLIR